jgi:hypothetical protein
MFSIKKITAVLVLVGAAAAPHAALAQNAEAELGQVLMGMDGSGSVDAGIAAVTGWHTCDVIRTGAGWGNHYVALTCTTGPFTNKWHIMKAAQKDAMLATALSAAASDKKVQVNIGSVVSGYREIRALYFHN